MPSRAKLSGGCRTMYLLQRLYATELGLLTLLMLVNVAGPPSFAQEPQKAEEGQQPKVVGDGRPQPFKVLYDRRVNFPLNSLTVSGDRKLLAVVHPTYQAGALPEYKIVVVDVATGKVIRELESYAARVKKLVFSPDSKLLYAGIHPTVGDNFFPPRNGALIVWDLDTGKRQKEMSTSLWDLSPDGKRLAVVDNWVDIDPGFQRRKREPSRFTLQVVDTATWKDVARLQEKNDVNVRALRFSPDGKTLALSVPPYSIRLWEWQAGKETQRIEATKWDEATMKLWGEGQFPILEFSPDGTMLASITDLLPDYYVQPRKIDLWQASTGKLVRSLVAEQYRPQLLAFTPKGDQLALATSPIFFRLLDVATGKTLQEFSRNAVSDLAVELYRQGLTPEQAPQAPDLFRRLWNLASGGDIKQGTMLNDPQCLAFAPDDRTLAIGENDGVIRLVDVLTGKEIRQFSDGTKMGVKALKFLEGGKRLRAQNRNEYPR